MLQNPCNSKVANLNLIVLSHKYVLCLEIPVKNFAVMNMLNCKSHLHKPVEQQVFWYKLLDLLLVLDFLVHVSSIGVIHHNTQELLVHK